ncbi:MULTISPECIES: hypothetical protein [Streptomyces]|uniref:hypothetical protein n=1 Tax=Streptomyces TaxID=1883 RepID=UPI0015E1A41A|nr:hypothetical protein [Streptomyces sp. ZL-24]
MTALAGRKVGDEVLFYAGKKFVARARIIGLFDNRALAEAVWRTDENQLKLHADHVIEQEYLEYHRGLCGRG